MTSEPEGNMPASDVPAAPPLPWRFTSSVVIGVVAGISRALLMGLNKTEVYGLERFLELLDSREDVGGRQRGLLTGMCDCGWPVEEMRC